MKTNKDIESNIIKDYQNNITIRDLMLKYHKSDITIIKIFKKNNIKIKNAGFYKRKISDNEYKKIGEMYENGENTYEIANKYKVTPRIIIIILDKLGIKRRKQTFIQRKYQVNDYFFDSINNWSWKQAYLLGWILSDGHINSSRNSITIALQEKDIEILYKLRDLIGYTGPLGLMKRRVDKKIGNNKIKQLQNVYRLDIGNKRIYDTLSTLCPEKDKTRELKFPIFIKRELYNDLIRGFWEGDGCLHIANNCHGVINIVSTRYFLEELQKILKEIGCKSRLYFNKKIYDGEIYPLHIGGNKNVLKFLNFIYKDAKLYLERKFDIFEKLVLLIKSNKFCRHETKKLIIESEKIIQQIKNQ